MTQTTVVEVRQLFFRGERHISAQEIFQRITKLLPDDKSDAPVMQQKKYIAKQEIYFEDSRLTLLEPPTPRLGYKSKQFCPQNGFPVVKACHSENVSTETCRLHRSLRVR